MGPLWTVLQCAYSMHKEMVHGMKIILRGYSLFLPPSPSTVLANTNENPIYLFLFGELRGLSPTFHIHVSVSDLYVYSQDGPCTYFPAAEEADWLWKYINLSQTHECGNLDCGRAIPFSGNICFEFSALVLCSGCFSPKRRFLHCKQYHSHHNALIYSPQQWVIHNK
jgi:hypothetical protein